MPFTSPHSARLPFTASGRRLCLGQCRSPAHVEMFVVSGNLSSSRTCLRRLLISQLTKPPDPSDQAEILMVCRSRRPTVSEAHWPLGNVLAL